MCVCVCVYIYIYVSIQFTEVVFIVFPGLCTDDLISSQTLSIYEWFLLDTFLASKLVLRGFRVDEIWTAFFVGVNSAIREECVVLLSLSS